MDNSTAAYYFHRLREIIAHQTADESNEAFGGQIELDDSCFGWQRKGKRGRGTGGKEPVFGLLKRGGKVHAKVIADACSATLMLVIEDKVVPDSVVYSDC